MNSSSDTLLINRNEVASLLTIEECISAVEHAFKLRAIGAAKPPGILGVHANDGGFHIKAGILDLGASYFVAKTNANFPENKKKNGLPTIQGIIVVSDAQNGRLLALMDSIEITIIRTGAATGVAAKYLSRNNSKIMTICGCGNQGRISLKALMAVRKIEKVFAYDVDASTLNEFISEMSRAYNIAISPVDDLRSALKQSDIVITCTPAKKYFIQDGDIKPGTFIAAVGSDNEDKQEIDPVLLSKYKVVADSVDQCATIGELHHAINSGLMKIENVYAELGEVIAGLKEGRENDEEIIIFDSTGTALQDVAASAIVYERAIKLNKGQKLDFAC
jgi:alanine dehydrogenase